MRTFENGATRDSEDGKLDYEGFLSPEVLEEFARYMDRHRTQADGELRDSDNWQHGMSRDCYIKSLIRHVMDLWFLHRGMPRTDIRDGHIISMREACCAAIFNLQGYLFETIQSVKVDDSQEEAESDIMAYDSIRGRVYVTPSKTGSP